MKSFVVNARWPPGTLTEVTDFNNMEIAALTPPEPVALVVDDEPVIRMDTADMVSDEGFQVVEARTVDAAYRFLTDYPSLKLVVTDVETPGSMTGYDLAWRISERWPHICVVVASGSARPNDGDLPPSAIFVSKPLSADVVHEAIEEYCGNCDVR